MGIYIYMYLHFDDYTIDSKTTVSNKRALPEYIVIYRHYSP